MRIAQLILALAICIGVVHFIGVFYVVPAIVTLLISLGGGLIKHGWHRIEDVVISFGAATIWPIVVLACVVHAVDLARTTKLSTTAMAHPNNLASTTKLSTTATTRSVAKSDSPGIEDLDHRKEGNQR